MKLNRYEWARDEVNRLLFDAVPKQYLHTVKLNGMSPDIVIVHIEDGKTPVCPVKAIPFINWLKSNRPSLDQIRAAFKKKLNIQDPEDLMSAAIERNSLPMGMIVKHFSPTETEKQ